MGVKSALGSTSNPMCVKTMNRVRKRESLFGSTLNNPEQKTRFQREIEATDRQIDQLVYELYSLNAEEIKIVEEART